ncbi:MAG: penicillin-binding protein 1A [Alphaproteobacteria bacterium]
MRWLFHALGAGFGMAVAGVVVGIVGVWIGLQHYGAELPDHAQLADYEPPIATRIYAADGRFLAEYARENRVFVPIEAIPARVQNAFIAAEDQHFRRHIGVDPLGIVAAAIDNVERWRNDRRPRGASTITQQVAKNFLLTNELSLERKIKEAILAMRLERTFSKDHILELYMNEIYLGAQTYGVAAAALEYFGKGLDELTLAEAAFLAGLPRAPSLYDPEDNPDGARERRRYVLDRMLADGYITAEAHAEAAAAPLVSETGPGRDVAQGPYFADEVRRRLERRYGKQDLFEAGFVVRTTLDGELQQITDEALRNGLHAYDRRRGFTGPIASVPPNDDWVEALRQVDKPASLGGSWSYAVVLELAGADAVIGLADGGTGRLLGEDLGWARPVRADGSRGPAPSAAGDILAPGDVVLVREVEPDRFGLRQIPEVEGAAVALDPNTGRVLALSGGFSFGHSEFNRATQALRQPGSAFKPFVYLAALEYGYTPQTAVDDAPVSIAQGPGLPVWEPRNYGGDFLGPSALRTGLEKSRNLMTVRLAQAMGMENVIEVAERFGIERGLLPVPSAALGSNEVTLLDLTAAYGAFANGGKEITPHVIARIQDRQGGTIAKADTRTCADCSRAAADGGPPPPLPDDRDELADPRHTYQIVSMLQGVIQRGTGQRANALGRPLAGKTGTTNDAKDTWFIGFGPDLVVGVYVGFDRPRSLGDRATGSSVALPIWLDVMAPALEDEPIRPFRVPRGLKLVSLEHDGGRILEPFVAGTEPGSGYAFAGGYVNERSTIEEPNVESGSGVGVSGGGLY